MPKALPPLCGLSGKSLLETHFEKGIAKNMKRVLALFALIMLLSACTAPIAPPPGIQVDPAVTDTAPAEQATADVRAQIATDPALPANEKPGTKDDPASDLLVGKVDDKGPSVIIVGELRNKSKQWITGFQVVVTYYDAGGTLIYTDEVPGEMTSIEPGKTAPFKVITDKTRFSGEYASYKIQYRRGLSDTPSYDLVTTGLDDKGVKYKIAEIVGQVYNYGKSVCDFPMVAVAYYNSNGQVIAVSGNYVTSTADQKASLQPGDKADFDLLTQIEEPYQSLKLWAACKYVDGKPSP